MRCRITFEVELLASGEAKVFNVKTIPIKPKPKVEHKTKSLKEIWTNDKLSFEVFRSELKRNGILNNENRLIFTGSEIKGCYYFLHRLKVLPELSMVEVYALFASAFKLKIKHARSLQGIDSNETLMQNIFSFYVSDSNEIHNSDELQKSTDI